MYLRCTNCAQDGSAVSSTRCACGGLFEVVQDIGSWDAERLKRLFDARRAERGTPHSSGVWRYQELIHPDLPIDAIVTKFEGDTGLYSDAGLTGYAGVRGLVFKAQGENPSGSFKDNGMTVAVSHGKWRGRRRFACTSTGNTSSSMAMYAARAGCEAIVLHPAEGGAAEKDAQTEGYGARLMRGVGGYDDGIQFLVRNSERLGLYVCNSLNPFRIEGQKSLAFELAHQSGWRLPDWIVVPGGALSNAAAIGKGLDELLRAGFIDVMPRIAVVQAEGAAPFHAMVESRARALTAVESPTTEASAIRIGDPPNWPRALHYVIEGSRGVTVAVSDDEIFDAKGRIDRSGIGCEPASAASLAGLRSLVQAGVVASSETAACILTGHMLKDSAGTGRATRSRPAEESSHLDLGPDWVGPPSHGRGA